MERCCGFVATVAALVGLVAVRSALAGPPPQRLPSAILVFPNVVVEGGGAVRDTRIEIVNLTGRPQQLSCFYVDGSFCSEFGFFIRLTPNQPITWLASQGSFSSHSLSAVPAFGGTGELKCRVIPQEPGVDAHNTVQGRAIVFGADGSTVSYGAVGFQRFTDGDFSGTAELDGSTYAQCPDEMHFAFVASEPGSESEIILAPCSEDLENRIPTTTTVQFLIYNEFEQVLSASTNVTCYERARLQDISHVFTRNTLGTETGHVVVRGVQSPVLAMLIDRVQVSGSASAVAGNEPAFRGGRSATIRFP